jgi:hypothetical protein
MLIDPLAIDQGALQRVALDTDVDSEDGTGRMRAPEVGVDDDGRYVDVAGLASRRDAGPGQRDSEGDETEIRVHGCKRRP